MWDSGLSTLSYTVKIGSFFPTGSETMLFQAHMTATSLTCSYENEVTGIEVDDFEAQKTLDLVDDAKKVEGAATATELEITTTINHKDQGSD